MNLHRPLYHKQYNFVVSEKRHPAMITGIGCGKTLAGCLKALLKALKVGGSLGCITAPTYPMLRDATKRTFFEICPPELIDFRNDTENIVGIKTPDGRISEITFRSTSDPDSLRGPNLLWFWMDEAAMSDYEAFQILCGRIRTRPEEEQQGWITTTPRGYNWVWKLWDQQPQDQFEAFFAETKDNIFLPKTYVESIYKQYEGSFALQELGGRFVAHEGLVYGDLYNPTLHCGIFPFKPSLPVNLTWDFGYPNPEAVLAIQQDGPANVFVIDEIYRLRTLSEDILAEARGRPWYPNVCDVIGDEARPDTILRLANLGLPIRPSAKGKILDGIKLMRSLLAKDTVTGLPILHIDKRCEMLRQEFGMYRWMDKKTMTDEFPERPIDQYNHALDALRYWAMLKWTPRGAVRPDNLKKPKRRVMAYQLM